MGYRTTASGDNSTALGSSQQQVDIIQLYGYYTEASGSYSTSIDTYKASDKSSLVMGQWNLASTVTSSALNLI